MPIERAVPSMIFIPASISRADKSAILVSAISRYLCLGYRANLGGERISSTLIHASCLAKKFCCWRCLQNEGEGTIFIYSDFYWDDLTNLILSSIVVCLGEVHDVHTMGTQCLGHQWWSRVCLTCSNLQLDER